MGTKKRLPSWLIPASLVALLWALRLLQAGSTPTAFDEEEGYVLAAASELARISHQPSAAASKSTASSPRDEGGEKSGLLSGQSAWPWQAYQLSDWENGTLLSVLLTVPLAALFGGGLLTLKVGALLWNSGTLLLLWAVVRRAANRRAATLAGALFVLFPGPILHHSATLHGFHSDATLLQLLYLWLLLRALGHAEPGEGPGKRVWFLCGVLGGFSIYFAYISAITVLCGSLVALGWMLRGRGGRRATPAHLAGLVVGIAPLLLYNLLNRGGGVSVYGERGPLDFVTPWPLAETWRQFWEQTAPAWVHLSNWVDQDNTWHNLFNLWFWLAAGLAVIWPLAGRLWGEPKGRSPSGPLDKVVPLCWGATLYIFYCAAHPIFPWHLFPLVVLLLGLIAVRAASFRSRPARAVAAAAVVPMLAFGAVANLRAIDLDRLGVGFGLQGANFPLFFDRVAAVAKRMPPCPKANSLRAELRRRWLSLPLEWARLEPVNARFAEGYLGANTLYTEFMGEALLHQALGEAPSAVAVTRFLDHPPAGLPPRQAAEVAGYCLGLMHRMEPLSADGPVTTRAIIRLVDAQTTDQANAMLQGIGFALSRAGLDGLATSVGPGAGGRLRQLGVGHGRGIRAAELFRPDRPCADAPATELQRGINDGLKTGLSRRYVEGIPAAVRRRLCATTGRSEAEH